MKWEIIYIVSGVVGAIGNPVSTQTDNPLDGSDSVVHDSEIKQNEDINKVIQELEQKDVVFETVPESLPETNDASVELVIQEDVVNPFEQFALPPPQENFDTFGFEDEDFPLMKIKDEIMETAAGFAPLPFLRKRQKHRKPFASRRNFKKHPHRRVHFFYPYYNYYTFYRPSSLRFY